MADTPTGTQVFSVTTNADGSTTSTGDLLTGTVDVEPYAFTKGLTYLGKDYTTMTDAQKVAMFKSTSLKDADIADLALLKPFLVRMYYED